MALNYDEMKRYLELLDPKAKEFDFRVLKSGGIPKNIRGSLDDVWKRLVKLDKQGYNIFNTVNGTDGVGVGNENITHARAVWRDIDDYKDNAADVPDTPVPPSFSVDSGGGRHDYFLTSTVDCCIDGQQDVQRSLTVSYGNDPGARDKARILRTPGSNNHKYDPPRPVTIIAVDTQDGSGDDADVVFYDMAVLTDLFGAVTEEEYGVRVNGKKVKKGSKTKAKKTGKGQAGVVLRGLVDENWDAEIVRDALAAIDPDEDWQGAGVYQSWVNICWSVSNACGQSEEGLDLVLEWSGRSGSYDEDEATAKYYDEAQTGTMSLGTLFMRAAEADWVHPRKKALVTLPMDDEQEDVIAPVSDVEWRDTISLKNPERTVGDIGSYDNVEQFLELSKVIPWQNDFDRQIYISNGRGRDEQITDEQATDMRIHMHRAGCRVGKDFFLDAVSYTARKDRRHPVREYLRDLKWDGKPRLARMLHTYAGCADNEYTEAVGLRWMVAAVRRVFQPGYKFDAMLILEGKQEAGKSSFAKYLAKSDWFGDATDVGASPKEIIETTEGNWIVECAELSGLRKSDINAVKTFVTRTSDKARLAYGRFAKEVQRQFVLMGTVNEDDYLFDDTGNRRFWPVKVGVEHPMDLDGLRRDVDQLWAEAVTYALDGEFSTVLPLHLKDVAAAEQEQRRVIDPVEEALTDTLGIEAFKEDEPVFITNDDVFKSLAIMEPKDRKGHVAKIVKSTMARLGWRREKPRVDGKSTHIYIRSGDWDGEYEVQRIRLHSDFDDRTKEVTRSLMLECDYLKIPRMMH